MQIVPILFLRTIESCRSYSELIVRSVFSFWPKKMTSYFITGSIVHKTRCVLDSWSIGQARHFSLFLSLSFFCYLLLFYIVDYEIIREAISRLKENLNKNKSSVIRKEKNSRSDLLLFDERWWKELLHHIAKRRSSNVIFIQLFSFLSFRRNIFIVSRLNLLTLHAYISHT